MKKLFLLSVLMISAIPIGKAANTSGMFIEPILTYETSTGDVKFPSPFNTVDSTVDGFGVGARIGMQAYDVIFLGADGRYSMPNFTASSIKQDVSAKSWNIGPFIGVQMPTPVGLRFWGSWILAGEVDPEKDKGVDEKFKSGNGVRLGAGFRIAMTSLNIEYQDITYNETTIEEVGIFRSGYTTNDIELHNKSVIFSVSFPISI